MVRVTRAAFPASHAATAPGDARRWVARFQGASVLVDLARHSQIAVSSSWRYSMASAQRSVGRALRDAWSRLAPLPGGRWLFGRLLTRMVPYTGTIRPRFLEVRPGFARVAMRDRRAVRNHLDSVHAIALTNLAEVASGVAMVVALPDDVRGIPIRISIDFVKKARGQLTAECRCDVPKVYTPIEIELHPEIYDSSGDVVARATVRWRLSPVAAPVTDYVTSSAKYKKA
jgi:acyl-coenzyme A thioesterase PaaI-like protein